MKKISVLAIAGVLTASFASAEMAEVKVGGEVRVRNVVQNDYDYNDSSSSGDRTNTTTSRVRVNVDAKIDETTKAYISLQGTNVWGAEVDTAGAPNTATTGNDTEAVDVSQAYVQLDQLGGQPLSLKIGRQILAYGEHRLVGSFEWSNFGRRFDALKLMYNTDAFSVDLWSAKVRDANGVLNTGNPSGAEKTATSDEEGVFNGIYATVKTIPTSTLDLYILQKKDSTAAVEDDFLTYGLRLNGGVAGVDWTVEGALQSGTANDGAATGEDKDANFYAVRAGYTIPNTPSIRIGGEYVFASGDDDATDDDDENFDQIYPTNHPLYGVTDITATNTLSNLKAWSLNASAKPVKGLKLLAEYWNYERDEDTLGDDQIGTEWNIQAWYALTSNVGLHAYYASFTPDDAITGGGAASDDPASNVTLQIEAKF